MSRQTIKSRDFGTIGHIETLPDGRRIALDANFQILGYYFPDKGVTQDAGFRVVAKGDVLSGLIYKGR